MRVVSLVPSLTETLFALGLDETTIVGRTAWCIEPRGRVETIRVLGGTKTPNLRGVLDLAPDLVVLEREENRREAYDALVAAGVSLYVAHVLSPEDVPGTLRELGERTGRVRAAEALAKDLEAALAERAGGAAGSWPSPAKGPRVVPLIWNDPLMSVAPTRYSGALLAAAGFEVPDLVPGEGYPRVSPGMIGEAGVTHLLLSSEPHDFSVEEGEALAAAVLARGHSRPHAIKVDGQDLTWFGARTATALRRFRARCAELAEAQSS